MAVDDGADVEVLAAEFSDHRAHGTPACTGVGPFRAEGVLGEVVHLDRRRRAPVASQPIECRGVFPQERVDVGVGEALPEDGLRHPVPGAGHRHQHPAVLEGRRELDQRPSVAAHHEGDRRVAA